MPQTAPVQRSTSQPKTRDEMLKYGAYLVRRGRALCQNRDRASQQQGSEYIARGQKIIAKANQTTGTMPRASSTTSPGSQKNPGQRTARRAQGSTKVVSAQHYGRYGSIMNTYELEEPAPAGPQAMRGRHAREPRQRATASGTSAPLSAQQVAGSGTRTPSDQPTRTRTEAAARHSRMSTPAGQATRSRTVTYPGQTAQPRATASTARSNARGGARQRPHVRIVDLDREDAIRKGMEPTRYQESMQQASKLQQAAMAQQHDMRIRASRQTGSSSRITVPRPHRTSPSPAGDMVTSVIMDEPVGASVAASGPSAARGHASRMPETTRQPPAAGHPERAAQPGASSQNFATTHDVRRALAAAEKEKAATRDTPRVETPAPAVATIGDEKPASTRLTHVALGLRSFSVFCGASVFLSYLLVGPWSSQTAMVITLSAGLTTLSTASLLEARTAH
ncbi:MAG: hypothetical protein Q4A93_04935 [Actinomycetota bacterium]|nr:hypothetical protein [Actinomycetota bacterium]